MVRQERATLRGGDSGAQVAVTANQWLDDAPPPGATYVYRVRARKLDTESARSAPAFATLVTIADYPAVTGVTLVRGTSVGQMRAAVDALRIAAGLAPGVYTDTPAAGSPVRAVHFQELRDALDPARELLGYPRVSFTDPLLTAGVTPIRAAHFNEIVTAVQAQVLP